MAEPGSRQTWLLRQDSRLTLTIHLQPGADRSEFAGLHGDALKIRVKAPPVDGKANQALLRFLASAFAVPLQHITLLRGASSRRKCVEIRDVQKLPDLLEIYLQG